MESMGKLIKTSSPWEQGSDFHWMTYQQEIPKKQPWTNECVLGGSGRDLFRLLLKHGMKTYKWRRLWIPAYFCNEVTGAILKTDIDVAIIRLKNNFSHISLCFKTRRCAIRF